MDATTTDINDLEKWVIGSDKKPQFQIFALENNLKQ